MISMYVPLTVNARIMRRAMVSCDASGLSRMWQPVRLDEPVVGAELCRVLRWPAAIAPTQVPDVLHWCWRWRGYHDRDGYPRINLYGTSITVARVWASICYSTLKPTEDAHHVCRNKWCVNPAHIEPQSRGAHYRLHGYIRKAPAEAEAEADRDREELEAAD